MLTCETLTLRRAITLARLDSGVADNDPCIDECAQFGVQRGWICEVCLGYLQSNT